MANKFIKNNKKDKIWWVEYEDTIGRLDFTFDKIKIYSFWQDYPQNLTKEEKEIFDKENPFWARFKE